MRIGSGPAMSIVPLSGFPTATSARIAATSSEAMGCMRAGGSRTVSPSVADSSDAADELEELRGADDRVRNLRGLDEVFLGQLRAEVAAREHAVGADDREGHMMADAGGRFGGVDVSAGRFEEVQNGLVFERRRVGDVDDNGRAGECVREAFAGERVDARGTGGGQDFVAIVDEGF